LTVLFVLWYLMLMRSRRQLEARGLEPADAARVVLAVPASRTSFWSRPHIAAILAPAPRAEAARRTDSPYEQLQSILRNAAGLAGPLRPLGARAAIGARQLLVSIEHADRQVADLARSLDPGEEERLADKVAALGAASTEVRQLLEKQLELVRALKARIEEGREERQRRVEMLRTLALHVTSLRTRASQAPAEVPSLSERVGTLCDEIGGRTLALAEASAAAGSRDTPTRG